MVNFNDKNILITGGAGFIGSNVVKYLNKQYPSAKVTVLDKFRSEEHSTPDKSLGHYKNLINVNANILCCDITDYSSLIILQKYKWDVIIHLAAISDTRASNQYEVLNTNLNTFDFFINLALTNDAHLVYASSASVYGSTPSPNYVNKNEIPEGIYAFSKLSMDNKYRLLSLNNPSLKITGLRYFNVYGMGEYFKGRSASMIMHLGLQILANKTPKLFKWGEQQRDFVFIEDVVDATLQAVGAKPGIYNVGSGIKRSFKDIVNCFEVILQKNIAVEYIDNPYTSYQADTHADISDTTLHLNYHPKFSLQDGIVKYFDEIKLLNAIENA